MGETSKATKRPWSRGNRGAMFMAPSHERWVVRGPEGEYVARINNPVRSTEESEANAELIVRAVNAHDELVAALREVLDNDGGGWSSRHAAENTYCPDCATDADAWRDQKEHHPGCAYVARTEKARAALSLAEPDSRTTEEKA
jgi:hypothetical protein